MSGFPNRPTRTTFGPTLEDARPVTNPQRELGADVMNLAFWQLAGAGAVLPMAIVVYNGATPAILYQALAFDPKSLLGNITSVKNGAGDYRFTFASSYPDENGNATSFTPSAAMAFVQGSAAQVAAVATLNGQHVDVTVQNGAGTPTDATIIVAVW
jgi:hypothetical protein